jgi:hypothetical protein
VILALLALGIALAAMPGVHRIPPDRLPLHEWAPIATASLVIGLLSIEGALVLIALPTVAHAVGAAGIADACHEVLAPFSSTPSVLGWAAAAGAAIVAARFVVAGTRARRRAHDARAEPWLGRHHELGEFDLVILPTAAKVAFGVPGTPPQVLVSRGLVDHVPSDAVRAIVRHETAHHRLGHAGYLALLAAAEHAAGFLPPVRQSVATIRDALEVWADQAAGQDPETRRSLRRALGALSGSGVCVNDRARRLRQSVSTRAPMLRALCYMPVALLAITAGLLAIGWLVDGEHAFAMASDCT